MSEQPKGSLTCHAAGKRGGGASKAAGADYHELGRLGGARTKDLYGPEHFSAAGSAGGSETLRRHGLAHYQAIGARGGARVKELIAAGRRAEERGKP